MYNVDIYHTDCSSFWRITVYNSMDPATEAAAMGETDFEDYAADLATRNAWALEAEVLPWEYERMIGEEDEDEKNEDMDAIFSESIITSLQKRRCLSVLKI